MGNTCWWLSGGMAGKALVDGTPTNDNPIGGGLDSNVLDDDPLVGTSSLTILWPTFPQLVVS